MSEMESLRVTVYTEFQYGLPGPYGNRYKVTIILPSGFELYIPLTKFLGEHELLEMLQKRYHWELVNQRVLKNQLVENFAREYLFIRSADTHYDFFSYYEIFLREKNAFSTNLDLILQKSDHDTWGFISFKELSGI